MKNKTVAVILAGLAGLLCLGNFFYKLYTEGVVDGMILFAGLFIIFLGAGIHYRKK